MRSPCYYSERGWQRGTMPDHIEIFQFQRVRPDTPPPEDRYAVGHPT